MAINFTGLYFQDFDSLEASGTTNTWTNNSTLPGWYLFRQPAPGIAITAYAANNGSSTTGSFYSYGAAGASERALGGLGSGGAYFGSPSGGNIAGWFAFAATNTSSASINQVNLSFNGEQWRNGGNTTPHTMVLEYGFGSTFETVTTWITPGANFDWTSPVATGTGAAVDGNTAGLVANRGGTLSSLNWDVNQTLWIRWVERNDAGNDHGLAIDNFSLSTGTTPPAVPTVTIAATDASAAETGGQILNTGTFTITRTGDTTAALTVNYTVAGTATNGTDYNALTGTVTIPAGQAATTIVITPVNDANATEGDESVTVTLTDTAAYDLGATSTATVTIADNTTGTLRNVGRFTSTFGAEIPAFDPGSDRLFVVAGTTVEIYGVSNTGALSQLGTLTPGFVAPAGTEVLPNSVAVNNGVVAVAYAIRETALGTQQIGKVAFFTAAGTFINAVDVGFLPDMLAFTPDGTKVLVANEGEPNENYSSDPEGSISIINLTNGALNATVTTADFTAFNSQKAALIAAGVRIVKPDATVAQDVEPEYITFSGDGQTAWITLQENNAIAVLDLSTNTITAIKPLGLKNHNLPGNGLDPSDRDGGINIRTVPVFGMYQPDAIASYTVNGQTYYITANEGDARLRPTADGILTGINEGGIFNEEIRVGSSAYVLDPTIFPNAATLKQNANLGRLLVTNRSGDLDGDGDFDQIHAFGARSFTIWDASGNQVFDSGDQFEQITAVQVPSLFNSNGAAATFDTRSDNKGPEPEGVVVGVVNGRTYAFIGLERTGDVIVYDVTNPTRPFFVEYINAPEDISPEGLTFVAAADSPTGKPLLITANEVSNTVSVFEFTPPLQIGDIQGAGHTSPFVGQSVTTRGIVTAVDSNGFYFQDPIGDGNIATSDGMFVFTSSRPTINVGDEVEVTGTVSEFIPGGVGTGNLSTTQIGGTPTITRLSTGNPLPKAVVLGVDRTPPNQVIDADQSTPYNVLQGGGVFNPVTDGLDFYESLEGMRVTINDALAVSATNRFGEIFTVANKGAGATGLSQRGTINIAPNDFNPERIQIQFDSGILPSFTQRVNVGAQLGDVTGVVGYNFGNFEVNVTEPFSVVAPSTLTPEVTTLTKSATGLTISSYNVLNLDPNDDDGDRDIADGRFTAIANQIVNNLKAPDIIGLQEVQDNDGSVNSNITAADQTLQRLIAEIAAAGGPTYQLIDNTFITDDASGGQPGGNIRTAFLYNPDRVSLVPGSVQAIGSQAPGAAFEDTRLPLVATFEFNGKEVTVVNNHFSSKGGSSPLFGANQPAMARQEDPAINSGLDQRQAQALEVKGFVDGILANNANANIAVVGDLNEFEFISPLLTLEQSLKNLTNTLPENERYSFIFDGNSQSLDHILVSRNLTGKSSFDIVHVNTEFADTPERASDHDPLLARFELPQSVINGTNRRDVLLGTADGDIITGGIGADLITTGGGRDRIVYTSIRDAGDIITDFTVGLDKLVFTQLLDSLVRGGYNGTNAIADGYVSFVAQGRNTIVRVDQNGLNNASPGRNFLTLQNVSLAEANNPNNFVF